MLSGANTYTGTTTVNGGDLSIGTVTITPTSTASIASGATLTSTGVLNLTPSTSAAQTFISGAGTLRLRNTSSTALAPDIYYDPNFGDALHYQVTIGSNIDVGSGTRFINGKSNRNDYERYGGDLVFAGNLTGSADLTFTGTPSAPTGGLWQVAYVLQGNNSSFSGGVILTDGANLMLENSNALTAANSVTFTPGAGATSGLYLYGRSVTIGALSGTSAGTMNIRNGSLVTDTNPTINPNIVRSNAVLTVQQSTNTTFNGAISDGPNDRSTGDPGTYYTLGLIKSGTGTLTLGGANSYTGTTTINAGTLQFAKQVSLYNNTPASWTATNIVVASGATAAFNVGGTGEFTSANIDTLKALGTGTGGFKSGSILAFDTTNASGGNFTYSSSIANPNGGANVLGLTKLGVGTLTLGSANTYTGATTVNAGDLSTGTFTLSLSGTVSIASGATYTSTGTLNLTPDTTAAQTFISGAGTLRLRNSSSTALAPDIYWNPTGSATSGAGYPVTIASNIDVGTGTRYINGISNRNDYERYGGDLVFSGNLSGSAGLTFTGTPNTGATGGPWQMAYTLAGNNSGFTGGIILTNGANLTLNNANALTSANSVTFTPSSGAVAGLYLYGRSVTIGPLSGTSAGTMNIRNGSLVTDNNSTINPGIVRSNAVLTVQQDTNTTFNGIISDGLNDHGAGDAGTYYTLGLIKSGTGTLTLAGANTYTGGTTISNGILALGADSGGTENAGSLGSGAVTINGGGQLRFGGSAGAIVTYNITNNVTLNTGTVLVADGAQHVQGTFTVGSGGGTLTTQYSGKDLYLDGAVSGSGALVVDNLAPASFGDGQVHFTGTNTYSGTLTINNSSGSSHGGRISVDSNNALANATIVMNGPRDIGFATTAPVFGALSGTGGITLTTGVNLSVGNSNTTSTYSGILSGPGSLTKVGTATQTISGGNTFIGSTTVSGGTLTLAAGSGSALGSTSAVTANSGGTLLLGASNQINNNALVTLAGGTFAKGNFSEGAANAVGVGALTLTASGSHLDFGTGTVGVLSFVSFVPATNTLVIDNWTGTANTVGSASTDRLIFNFDQTTNLATFSFTGYVPGAVEFALGGGFFEVTPLTPVPEPATYLMGILTLGVLGYHQRRRGRGLLRSLRLK